MKTIVVANQKGGVGKTTLARHLAFFGAEKGLRVLAVDMDVQGNFSTTFKTIAEDFKGQTVPEDQRLRLLRAFAEAAQRGDLQNLKAALAEDVVFISDGGGKVPSFGKPLQGGQRVAMLYFAVCRRFAGAVRTQVARVNGEPGLLRFIDGQLESVQAFEWADGRIVHIHTQRNPDKLARIAARLATP